jgi:primase-polymerase (primpol)-like protein
VFDLRLTQSVRWCYVDRRRDKKPDKRPMNPHNLHNAGVNWPNTWRKFPHTYSIYLMWRARGVDGIGLVLTAEDPFVGLDLDH